MGFSVGRYAKIWKLEDKGTYAVCNMSIGRKNPDTKVYVNDFKDGFVSFVGAAYNKIKGETVDEKSGLTVIIKSCDVTNLYTSPEGKVSYKPHYAVFDIDFPNYKNDGNSKKEEESKSAVEDYVNAGGGSDEEELPFN